MTDAAPTIVLGCAKDIRHLMPPVLELLAGRGLQVEVVSGLELRDDAPVLAAQRLPGACFVLFDDNQATVMERARLRLRHAGVQASRIASLPIDWRGPADVLAAIEAMGVPVTPGPRRATLGNLLPPPAETTVFPPPHPISELEMPRRATLHSASVPVLEHGDDGDGDAWIRGRRRKLLGLGGAAATLVAGLAVVAFSGDDAPAVADATSDAAGQDAWAWLRPAELSSVAAADAQDVPPLDAIAAAGLAPPVDTAASNVVALVAGAPPGAPQEIAVGVSAIPTSAVPATPAAEPIPSAAPVAPQAAADAVVIEDVPEAEPSADAEPAIDHEEMQAIYSGLVAQRFRALDILLIAPEPRKKVRKRYTKAAARMAWAQANAYCDGLEVAGVDDWRLPQVGELGSITDGELIAAGKFWSQTEGDTFGRSRVVWNTQTARMGTAPVAWKGGRVVCVRTMARAPEVPPAP